MSDRVVWCWADGTDYGHPNTTCTLPYGHVGEHEWFPDSEIKVSFK